MAFDDDIHVTGLAELRVQALTASKMLDEYALPPTTKRVIAYAIAIMLHLIHDNPELLNYIVDDINASIVASRKGKLDG